MRAYKSAVLALVALILGGLPAAAQDPSAIEVTPYLGLGSAAASPVGTAVTVPLTSALSLETDVAYRHGEGRINALSTNVSLLYVLPRIGQSTPYAAAGIGLAQYGSPVLGADGSPIGTLPRIAPTINAGAGVKTPITGKFDLRTDARWFKSFGREGSEQFRVAQGLSFDVGKR